jgi:cytochrome P450 family 110
MLPAGPRSALWQSILYLRDPMGVILRLARKFGDPFTVPTLVRPLVLTSTNEGVKQIFAADPDTFTPFAGEMGIPLLGRGSMLLQYGQPHRRARKLMQPPFHGARMRAYGQRMGEIAEQHLKRAPAGRFDIEELFRSISLDVILSTVFGVGTDEIPQTGRSVLSLIKSFTPLIATFAFLRNRFFPPWRRFQRLMAEVHGLLRDQIAVRRRDGAGEDICGLLVAARDESGQPMDEQEIVEQLVTLLMAGHETTATALAWAVDEIWRQPRLLAQLRESLSPDPEKLAADKLLDAVCAETLRLHPIVPIIARKLEKPFELGGHTLPAGAGVGACLAMAHRREVLYPEPDQFRPERFLDGRTFSPQEYFPFGGGARRCLGAAFAFYEMKIVLGKLVLGGDLQLASPTRARTGVRPATVGPRGGISVSYAPYR